MKVAIRQRSTESDSRVKNSYVVSDFSMYWCDVAFEVAPKPVGDPPHYVISRLHIESRSPSREMWDISHSIEEANQKSYDHARAYAENKVRQSSVLALELADETGMNR